jgi:NitT/TauT family transport system permease protein
LHATRITLDFGRSAAVIAQQPARLRDSAGASEPVAVPGCEGGHVRAGDVDAQRAQPPVRRWAIWAARSRSTVLGAVGVVAFLAWWQAISVSGVFLRGDIPTATATLRRAGELMVNGDLLWNVWETVWASGVGFMLAFVVAVPAGLLLGMSERLYAMTSTVVELLRPLPPIAFVPLLVLVSGQGLQMKAAIVAMGCVWPLLINTIHGVHGTDGTAIATGRSFGWSRAQIARRVIWPSAIPAVMTGVRITVSIAVILCIGAEYIGGSTTGIGSWLLQQSMLPQGMESVCAGVIIAGVLGLLVNGVVSILDARFAGWASKEGSA